MDDRTQPGHNAPPNRSAPNALNPNADSHRNGRRGATRDERTTTNQPSSAKPDLTERERRERWPVD
jgi:hypothetical protein